MIPEDLKKKVSSLPRAPGVYLMKNARGVVLYVGKAGSLRDRVGSYFQDARSGERLQITAMMPQVAEFEVIPAESEVDALLMEARLIKATVDSTQAGTPPACIDEFEVYASPFTRFPKEELPKTVFVSAARP